MKKTKPVVSVVTPTFNGKEKVDLTIGSLLVSAAIFFTSLRRFVNYSGEDGTVDFLSKKYNEEIESGKLIVIRSEHGGVSSARNRGIEHARGEYLTFLDGDDYALPSRLHKLFSSLQENNADFVHAKSYFVDKSGAALDNESFARGIPKKKSYWKI